MYLFQRTICNCGIHLITINGCVSLTQSSEVCSCRFSGLSTHVQTALALVYADPQRASIIHHRGGPSNDTLDYRLKVKAVLLNSTLFNLSIEQN